MITVLIQKYLVKGLVDRPDEWKNKLNLSQLTLVKPSTRIDSNKALATLDTNIFELLPAGNQRQIEINNFFDLFNQLIGTAPSFNDGNEDNVPETIINEQTDLDRQSAQQLMNFTHSHLLHELIKMLMRQMMVKL